MKTETLNEQRLGQNLLLRGLIRFPMGGTHTLKKEHTHSVPLQWDDDDDDIILVAVSPHHC